MKWCVFGIHALYSSWYDWVVRRLITSCEMMFGFAIGICAQLGLIPCGRLSLGRLGFKHCHFRMSGVWLVSETIRGTIPGVLAWVCCWWVCGFVCSTRGSVGLVDDVTVWVVTLWICMPLEGGILWSPSEFVGREFVLKYWTAFAIFLSNFAFAVFSFVWLFWRVCHIQPSHVELEWRWVVNNVLGTDQRILMFCMCVWQAHKIGSFGCRGRNF